MSNDQQKALRCAYTVMKEKFLKYNMQVRKKLVFLIATMLDHRFKRGHIPYGEHNFFKEILLNILELYHRSFEFYTDWRSSVFIKSQALKSNDEIYGATIK